MPPIIRSGGQTSDHCEQEIELTKFWSYCCEAYPVFYDPIQHMAASASDQYFVFVECPWPLPNQVVQVVAVVLLACPWPLHYHLLPVVPLECPWPLPHNLESELQLEYPCLDKVVEVVPVVYLSLYCKIRKLRLNRCLHNTYPTLPQHFT